MTNWTFPAAIVITHPGHALRRYASVRRLSTIFSGVRVGNSSRNHLIPNRNRASAVVPLAIAVRRGKRRCDARAHDRSSWTHVDRLQTTCWDRDLSEQKQAEVFARQCLEDVDTAMSRLFKSIPEIDILEVVVRDHRSHAVLMLESLTATTCAGHRLVPWK
jgi:hypothetical protein